MGLSFEKEDCPLGGELWGNPFIQKGTLQCYLGRLLFDPKAFHSLMRIPCLRQISPTGSEKDALTGVPFGAPKLIV